MKRWVDQLPRVTRVKTESLALDEPFQEMAARFAHQPNSVVLLSGGAQDSARHHILALWPWLVITGWRGRSSIQWEQTSVDVAQAPLDVMQSVLRHCRIDDVGSTAVIEAGLFGYLAYDLKDDIETLPRTTIDDTGLPLLWMVAPSLLVVQACRSGTIQLHVPLRDDQCDAAATATIDRFLGLMQAPPDPGGFAASGGPPTSNVTQPAYEEAVQRIKEYIAAGDVYQVNLSQRFAVGFQGDGYSLFKTLFNLNPAPFFAYINAGDHQIVSTSPERFLLRSGRRVETRPIKGTRPRGATPETDRVLQAELADSPKDDAELSMIVDLLRNDIGKVCEGGSVVVRDHKRLEAYQNVHHLVSVVEGLLAEDMDSVDLIRATFPGGSITGCPKIRAMEIIDELESCRRHIYTGSIGYISFHDTMDLSIAIRTATIVGDRLLFSVGGGIVYDSDPRAEFEETLHKGLTVMSVFQRQPAGSVIAAGTPPVVWHNGRMVRRDQAVVAAFDLGLHYGAGLFETIRVERGRPCRLAAHLSRFNRSWRTLFGTTPPDLTWDAIIAQTLAQNGLDRATAAVKILATRGDDSGTGFTGSVLVMVRPYVHRLAAVNTGGLKLATYPHVRLTPLADHKTLNYLFCYQAGIWAREQGADEAVMLNPDRTVAETNSANLLLVSNQTLVRPWSAHVLPGVMQAAIGRRLAAMGYAVAARPVRPTDLLAADAVLLTNALMGAVPAISLDRQPLAVMPDLVAALNADLFNPDEDDEGV